MSAIRGVLRKIVPGLTTAACAVGVATLSVSVIDGDLHWFGLGAAIRVGLPSFVVGLLFFPVNEKTLASRIGFALRAGFAAAVSCVVHRVLWTALQDGGEAPELGINFPAVVEVLRNPSSMLPSGALDTTAMMGMAAVAGATVAGFVIQPALKRLARGRRPSVASALSALNSTGVGAHSSGAPVRTM